MTPVPVAAVVRCSDLIGGVYGSVDSLRSQLAVTAHVAVVGDPSTPAAADRWLAELARSWGLHYVRVDSTAPGDAFNAGLRSLAPAEFGICLEAGESLAPSALHTLVGRFEAGVSLATCGIEWLGPGTGRRFSEPAVYSAADLLADPDAAHVSSMFRWRAWEAASGFDEQLPALEYADLWLRILEGGGRVVGVAAPLLRRIVHPRALYRRTWLTPDYARAARLLIDRHIDVARSAPALILAARERAVNREHIRHRAVQARGRQLGGEIEALAARTKAVLADVPDTWKAAADLGALSRTSPLSHDWGYARGTPADRPAIERYLAGHAEDVRGSVLEIQEDDYTRRFGGSRVQRSDVLDVDAANPRATIVGDLRAAPHLESGTYDCIILTQTLHVIDDMTSVVRECERLLKPGGVLLATLPSASRVCLEYGPDGDFWRTTEAGARRLFTRVFPAALVETSAFGNPLVNAAFAFGLGGEELPRAAYEDNDPYFPMLIGVRAQKPETSGTASVRRRGADSVQGLILMYHRIGPNGTDPHRLSVAPHAFRAQLDWLTRTCTVVPLSELSAGTAGVRAVALTFDDGYVDNVVDAVPMLRESGVPATFFLTTAEADGPFFYWWDRLAASFTGEQDLPSALSVHLPSGRRDFTTGTREQRLAAHWAVYEEVLRLPAAERERVLAQVSAWAGPRALPERDRRMTSAEVRQLAAERLWSIGAHTRDHLFLPSQPDDVLTSELVGSRQALEHVTGRAVDSCAYPFGAVDERVVAAARRAGFSLAVTCEERAVTSKHDRLALPRVAAADDLDLFVERVERAFGTRR